MGCVHGWKFRCEESDGQVACIAGHVVAAALELSVCVHGDGYNMIEQNHRSSTSLMLIVMLLPAPRRIAFISGPKVSISQQANLLPYRAVRPRPIREIRYMPTEAALAYA